MKEPDENFEHYKGSDRDERNYGKAEAHHMNAGRGEDKEISSSHLAMNSGGKDTGGNNGPTGSSRSYPKKSPGSTHPSQTDWNPIKKKPSTYAIEGCG